MEPSPRPAQQQAYTDEEIARLRWGFLESLNRWTLFFQSLNDAWRSDDPAALDSWKAAQERISVTGWLLEVIADTLAYWTEHPNSPQAELASEYRHFWWRGGGIWLQQFAPVFMDPLPRISQPHNLMERAMGTRVSDLGELNASIGREKPGYFKARMREQFEDQLSEYTRRYERAVFDEEWLRKHPKLLTYLTWLMYRLHGVPLEKVIQEFPGVSKYEYPKETVKHRVADLAKALGIQIADWK